MQLVAVTEPGVTMLRQSQGVTVFNTRHEAIAHSLKVTFEGCSSRPRLDALLSMLPGSNHSS